MFPNHLRFGEAICQFLLLLAPLSESLLSKQYETDSLMMILQDVEKETLVIFDLDNTLMESSQHLGSSQWADDLGTKLVEAGKSYEEADRLVNAIWCEVQPQIKVRTIDPQTKEVLQILQAKGNDLFIMTARNRPEIQFTHQQLSSLQLHSYLNYMPFTNFEVPLTERESIYYENGVLFSTSMHKKGIALKAFFDQINRLPKRIVFIDDKWSHVKDIGLLAEQLGIEYVGVRFSGADERVRTYDPEIARIQYEHLPYLISDEEAAQKKNDRNRQVLRR